MRFFLCVVLLVLAGASPLSSHLSAQDNAPTPEIPKTDAHYRDTFSGDIVNLSAARVIVARSILGKPTEQRTFWIKPETKVEGKLKMKVKVTVGWIPSDDGDIALLIVVRPQKK